MTNTLGARRTHRRRRTCSADLEHGVIGRVHWNGERLAPCAKIVVWTFCALIVHIADGLAAVHASSVVAYWTALVATVL